MKIYDPLYGPFCIPRYLVPLILTPEVRRLSQIRLLNALSPSLAALGEVRRYSHTLGVLYLCEQVSAEGYSTDERRALLASVLLHDIGTPPFAHLFEYHLRDQTGWSHEGIIRDVLWGQHAPENRAHQMFAGQTIEFRRALDRLGISTDIVERIVTERHPLSKLLFGTLDLDNLDNVARMSWALGLPAGAPHAIQIASALHIGHDGTLCLSEAGARDAVRSWAALRREIYEILVFDPPTVAAQAVLSEAIGRAIRDHALGEEDWCLTDEQLLDALRLHKSTKDLITREYLGKLPDLALCVQIPGALDDLALHGRGECKAIVESVLRDTFPRDPALGYVFLDRGAFSKSLTFTDRDTGMIWRESETSTSIILYGFVRHASRLRRRQCEHAYEALLSVLRLTPKQVSRVVLGPSDPEDAQSALNLASS